MITEYTHINNAISEEELEKRYIALVDSLGLGDPEDLIQEVVDNLRSDILLVDSLERAGVNLSKTRDIERWAYFDMASNAKQFTKALTKNHKGYRARVGERNDGDHWPVAIRSRGDLRLVSVGQESVAMCMLAHSHNGWHDGFEATIEDSSKYNLDTIKGAPMTAKQLAGSGISYRPGFERPGKTAKA